MQAPLTNLLIKVFSVKPVMARGSSLTQMEALDHQIIYSRIRTMLPKGLVVSSLKISNNYTWFSFRNNSFPPERNVDIRATG